MPLDALGRTVRILLPPPPLFPLRHLTNSFLQRATLTEPASTSPWPKGLGNLVKLCRAGDRALQLLLFNEECLVSASHQLALITSLPFDFYRMRGSQRGQIPKFSQVEERL